MAFKFYQTRPNKITHNQTRSSYSSKQGAQTVNCLVTKKCAMVFGHQTFLICTGLKAKGISKGFFFMFLRRAVHVQYMFIANKTSKKEKYVC